MKVWLKLLIGGLLGAIFGLVLPKTPEVSSMLGFLFELLARIGRYAFIPLLVFSIPVAVYEMHGEKRLGKMLVRTFLVIAGGLFVFSALGLLGVSLINPPKVKLDGVQGNPIDMPQITEQLLSIFPANPLSAFAGADFLLPIFLFALAVGMAFCYDRSATKLVVSLFDSMSHVFYHLNSFVVEFLGVIVIGISAFATVRLQNILAEGAFTFVLLTLFVEALVIILVIVPVFLYFASGRKNPYVILYGLLGPAIAGFLSGDVNFAAGTLFKHSKDNLGIHRRANSIVSPMFLSIGRAGTMLVATTAFVIVQTSYTNYGFQLEDYLKLFALAPLIALGLGPVPGNGAIVALTSLCGAFGRFEESALIAMPIAFPMAAIGTLIDIVWIGVATYVIAQRDDLAEIKPARHFI